jgi:hypothetical protein
MKIEEKIWTLTFTLNRGKGGPEEGGGMGGILTIA